MSNQRDRTDRLLIAIALVILLLAGGAFYFDGWMWGNRQNRGDRIGTISTKSGDIRVKFEGDLKWARAARGQEIAYNDSIYAGEGSQAELSLGQSNMTVTENTLVVLRRERDAHFLNLNYGTLFGKMAKNEKIMIDTGAGKPIELSANSQAQIVLRKTKGGKTELNVISGEAHVTIDGEKKKLTNSVKLVLEDKKPVVEVARLIALKPLKADVLYSQNPEDLSFAWEWSSKKPVLPQEKFTLEFSAEPSFDKIHARKEVVGGTKTHMRVSKSLSLYYRIRGPRNELSQVEKVNYVRMLPPLILKPLVDQHFLTPQGQNAMVEIAFQSSASSSGVFFQVASDPDFNQILVEQNALEMRQVKELSVGSYFLRARHNFGVNKSSAWTEVLPFKIEPRLEILPLAELPEKIRVLIPNRPYPDHLYKTSEAHVRSYLAQKGFLANHFPFKFDQMNLMVDGQKEPLILNKPAWPEKLLSPARYSYKYQISKTGYAPSPVSSGKKLEIAMEPPRPVGPLSLGAPLEDGSREAHWAFTPLLFARSYDVEVSTDPYFSHGKQLKVEEPFVTENLNPGAYFWRARARDSRGRIISEFSKAERIQVPDLVPQSLARIDREKRAPAATASSTLKLENKAEDEWYRNGWWAWVGTGANYVDYRQSVQDRGTVTSHSPKAASQYLEVGYDGYGGWGGVVSYKSTPGEITVENAALDRSSFTWSTLGVEGLKRSLTRIPWTNIPLVYGIRVGLQQHKTPFLFLDADTNLQLKQNKMDMASVGFLAEVRQNRWTFYWLSRYQYPFSSTAEGSNRFEIKPTFAFDGLVGSSYNLTKQLKMGLFWYGQWHQYNFVYADPDVTNVGFQSLFYSNIDLRLGFEF